MLKYNKAYSGVLVYHIICHIFLVLLNSCLLDKKLACFCKLYFLTLSMKFFQNENCTLHLIYFTYIFR